MFGIDFARPRQSLKLKMAWDMLHTLNFGVFGQMIVIPLMQKHRILTQVAGYHTEVIKFLPPITITKKTWTGSCRRWRRAGGHAALPRRGVGDGYGVGEAHVRA
jgi:acetylornithine/succinyldiaminopimelate/putrescine aminotransferase